MSSKHYSLTQSCKQTIHQPSACWGTQSSKQTTRARINNKRRLLVVYKLIFFNTLKHETT